MTDWNKVYGYQKNAYVQSFPVTSFELTGLNYYINTIKTINVGDILDMDYEPTNQYDNTAICVKNNTNICGYVAKDIKEKIKQYVPSKVKVIEKRLIKSNTYKIRVDIEFT